MKAGCGLEGEKETAQTSQRIQGDHQGEQKRAHDNLDSCGEDVERQQDRQEQEDGPHGVVVDNESSREHRHLEPKHHIAMEGSVTSTRQRFVRNLQHKIPRTYYITTQLILPLLTLIGMAFLFGWILATLEMDGEIFNNDAAVSEALQRFLDYKVTQDVAWHISANKSTQCVADAVRNKTLLLVPQLNATSAASNDIDTISVLAAEAIQECTDKDLPKRADLHNFLLEETANLTFDWMSCYAATKQNNETICSYLEELTTQFGLNTKSSCDNQRLRYILSYAYEVEARVGRTGIGDDEFFSSGDNMSQIASESTGSKGCEVNVAGGALFWFTIMTTIGYGNTAPITNEGRLLVYIAGGFTIICFLVLNNTAAKVWKHTFEDFFLRYNMEVLTMGPLSVIFWLCLTVFWMLVIAIFMQLYSEQRTGVDFPLKAGDNIIGKRRAR